MDIITHPKLILTDEQRATIHARADELNRINFDNVMVTHATVAVTPRGPAYVVRFYFVDAKEMVKKTECELLDPSPLRDVEVLG